MDQEQTTLKALKYQLIKWQKLVSKYLPATQSDRDDIGEIEKLIQKGIVRQPINGVIGKQKLWQLVKSLEEGSGKDIKEAMEAKAIMIVNFGTDGKTHSGLINGGETLPQMLLKSFDFYCSNWSPYKEDS